MKSIVTRQGVVRAGAGVSQRIGDCEVEGGAGLLVAGQFEVLRGNRQIIAGGELAALKFARSRVQVKKASSRDVTGILEEIRIDRHGESRDGTRGVVNHRSIGFSAVSQLHYICDANRSIIGKRLQID